jgi:UDP-N-acetylmuramyl pentapeptide phosphotransferase/UDP-N-acetylglucosamine-1-phosphate transferase
MLVKSMLNAEMKKGLQQSIYWELYQSNLWKSLATPILLLAVPILDTTTVVVSRIRRGVSPLQGGHDHLSHRLMNRGVPRKQAVILLWGLSVLIAICVNLIN